MEFYFEIRIRPGKDQEVADPLSRQRKYRLNESDPHVHVNQQTILSPERLNISVAPVHLITPVRNSDSEEDFSNSEYGLIDDEWEDSEDSDDEYGDIEQLMEVEGLQESGDPHWFQLLLQYLWYGQLPMVLSHEVLKLIKSKARNFVFKEDRLYKKLKRNGHEHHVRYTPWMERKEIIRQYHQTLGHMQCSTVLPILEVRYYWPTMEKDLKDYQLSCSECRMNRVGGTILDHYIHTSLLEFRLSNGELILCRICRKPRRDTKIFFLLNAMLQKE